MPNRLLDRIRHAALLRDGGGLSDGQLLALFVRHRDGDAFAALLNRHGPMVMGVCRRVLLHQHDAEDAFQATFLIFARKAGSVNAQDSVGGWLYRVAYRSALEARARNARRRGKEQQVNDVPHPAIEPDEGRRELLALLDKELDRLPDKYRVPVVLCELEGRSRKEVARTLGLPEGTLSWRLAQAKKILARKLSRHGVALSVGALAAAMSEGTGLSPVLRASTVEAALTAGAVPAQVLALTEGVMKVMLLTKLKITACFAALALLASVGATGLTYRATAQEPKQVAGYGAALASRPQADDLESLRLEMEALRKELRATRERVKTLEGEVRALKGRGGMRDGMPGMPPVMPPGNLLRPPEGRGMPGMPGEMPGMPPGAPPGNLMRPPKMPPGGPSGNLMRPPGKAPESGTSPKRPGDPLSGAEEALKRLRGNPDDKQAAAVLERALKRLKEREKPKVPDESDLEKKP
jgi:RNA polymerase sigma factor (sigma-70 family)